MTPSPSTWITPRTPPPLPSAAPLPGPVPDSASKPTSNWKRRPTRPEDRQPTPEQLTVRPWPNRLLTEPVPTAGFYVERYYAPIVGPTCLLLLRTLCTRLDTDTEGFAVETAGLAASIGCSSKGGVNSQFWKAVRRGGRFGLIKQVDDRLSIRTEVSQLSGRMVQRLPTELRREHQVWTAPIGAAPLSLFDGKAPSEALAPIEVLRLAARGLCSPAELRSLDTARLFR